LLLAERGYKTVGVDISPDFISRAKELAIERDVTQNCDFRVGDMRDVASVLEDHRGRVDVAVNLLTTHGYWDEATDIRIFEQARRLVKLNGLLIIHTVNRDFLVKHFQARDWGDIQEDRFILMERRLDLETSRMFNTWKYFNRDGEDLQHLRTVELDHLVYSNHELKNVIESGGWRYETCYGGYDLQELTVDSFGMVMVGINSK
jgi:SAM-dependent methyltransferase